MTTLPAATATHAAANAVTAADIHALMFAGAALWAICYVIACAIWPFKPCTRCDGRGKFPSPSGRNWRYCRHCTDGLVLRIGRRIYNHLHDHNRNHSHH
jgi:hypothetical protein